MTNVVGLQTDDAYHVCQNSSAHVARVVDLQTDTVVVTDTRFRSWNTHKVFFKVPTFSDFLPSFVPQGT